MELSQFIKKDPNGIIARAYALAQKAHRGQKRKTGEPYFNHALQTAETLSLWKMDPATIAAGLLHDVAEDTAVTIEEIKKEFGEEIAFLVAGVTKLGHIKYRTASAKAENLRKMLLALSQDLRVMFVKLADRLHNMRTLSALPREKQRRIALETDEIYAPLAYRLGMSHVSGELHDLAFPFLHPKEYEWLTRTVREEFDTRTKYLEHLKPVVEKIFREHGIHYESVDLRAKRWSSLYAKLMRSHMDLGRIYDLVAMRVIVKDIPACYAAMGVLHELWPPLPGRIKDYIALPKGNNYRSLHTTVIGPEGKYVEFQIRTQEMHDEAEYGIAAHWIYDQKKRHPEYVKGKIHSLTKEIPWVNQLRGWLEKYREDQSAPEALVESMKIDFFKDRIFVITPRGDVIDLPAGATPIDFAYQIHSVIGDTCVGAKVNNEFASLDKELVSGDVVEIITQKNKRPSEDWLKFVKTSAARDHIRAVLRSGKNTFATRARTPTKIELRIVVKDRVGLLKDITSVIARSHINITSLRTVNAGSDYPIDKIECATTDTAKIQKLILKLKKIKEVKEVSYVLR